MQVYSTVYLSRRKEVRGKEEREKKSSTQGKNIKITETKANNWGKIKCDRMKSEGYKLNIHIIIELSHTIDQPLATVLCK